MYFPHTRDFSFPTDALPSYLISSNMPTRYYKCPHLSTCSLASSKRKACSECTGLNHTAVITHTTNVSLHPHCSPSCAAYGGKLDSLWAWTYKRIFDVISCFSLSVVVDFSAFSFKRISQNKPLKASQVVSGTTSVISASAPIQRENIEAGQDGATTGQTSFNSNSLWSNQK